MLHKILRQTESTVLPLQSTIRQTMPMESSFHFFSASMSTARTYSKMSDNRRYFFLTAEPHVDTRNDMDEAPISRFKEKGEIEIFYAQTPPIGCQMPHGFQSISKTGNSTPSRFIARSDVASDGLKLLENLSGRLIRVQGSVTRPQTHRQPDSRVSTQGPRALGKRSNQSQVCAPDYSSQTLWLS